MIEILIGAILFLIGLGVYFGLRKYFDSLHHEDVKRQVQDDRRAIHRKEYNKALEKYIRIEK